MRGSAGRPIRREGLPRDGAHDTSGERLHGASDTSTLRSDGSVGIRSNPLAAMKNTPRRTLRDRISKVSGRTDVRAGTCLLYTSRPVQRHHPRKRRNPAKRLSRNAMNAIPKGQLVRPKLKL